jgi:hypothetical protein
MSERMKFGLCRAATDGMETTRVAVLHFNGIVEICIVAKRPPVRKHTAYEAI